MQKCQELWAQAFIADSTALLQLWGAALEGSGDFEKAAVAFSRREVVESWGALLHRLATARAVDRLRQRQRRNTRQEMVDFEFVGGGEAEPYQNAQAGELSERLRTALGRLPQRQAEVFALHALEGWKHDEIARQMQITCDAVGVLLHRARARLRELLAPVMKMESRKVAS